MNKLHCVAGVLIGGKSSRFGRPKSIEALPGGRSVVAHLAGTAADVADEVVLLGAESDVPPELREHLRLDDFEKGAGPISGLCSLLTYAKDRWALMLACDIPLVQKELFCSLFEAAKREDGLDVVAYGTGLPYRPFYTCCTLYHPRILPRIWQAIDLGEFRLQSVLKSVNTMMIQPSTAEQRMLQDMNTPEDKARLLGD